MIKDVAVADVVMQDPVAADLAHPGVGYRTVLGSVKSPKHCSVPLQYSLNC